jgi:hypothetical protein
MIGELFKHSADKHFINKVPLHLRSVHKTRKRVRDEQGVMLPPPVPADRKMTLSMWDEEDCIEATFPGQHEYTMCDDEDLDAIDLL